MGNSYTSNPSYAPANASCTITGDYIEDFRSVGAGGWEHHIYVSARDVKSGTRVQAYSAYGWLSVVGYY